MLTCCKLRHGKARKGKTCLEKEAVLLLVGLGLDIVLFYVCEGCPCTEPGAPRGEVSMPMPYHTIIDEKSDTHTKEKEKSSLLGTLKP